MQSVLSVIISDCVPVSVSVSERVSELVPERVTVSDDVLVSIPEMGEWPSALSLLPNPADRNLGGMSGGVESFFRIGIGFGIGVGVDIGIDIGTANRKWYHELTGLLPELVSVTVTVVVSVSESESVSVHVYIGIGIGNYRKAYVSVSVVE